MYTIKNQPDKRVLSDYFFIDNIFTDKELDKIVEYCDGHKKTPGIIGAGPGELDESFRKSKISWISVNDESSWFLMKKMDAVLNCNKEQYKFDLNSFFDFQYTTYTSDNSLYNWHQDYSYDFTGQEEENIRKLSSILVLSDEKDYEGGKLIIGWKKSEENCVSVEQKRGRLIIFPSFVMHKVCPVTKGTRKSLVNWYLGPWFK